MEPYDQEEICTEHETLKKENEILVRRLILRLSTSGNSAFAAYSRTDKVPDSVPPWCFLT
jgi:hypothetical protein